VHFDSRVSSGVAKEEGGMIPEGSAIDDSDEDGGMPEDQDDE
jgi:hypothetical protein